MEVPDSQQRVNLFAAPPPPAWGAEVDGEAMTRLADAWHRLSFPPPAFDYQGLPPLADEPWWTFCILGVSVIACLWPPEGEEQWGIELDGERLVDAPAVFGCFTRSELTRAADFAAFDEVDAERFFSGFGHLQLVPERGRRLREVAEAMLRRWDGEGRELLEEAGWDGPKAVRLLVEVVPGYRDRASSPVGLVAFDKLAHLCVAMMAARSSRPISRLEEFPVYPDYMLPRALRHLGVLRYAPGLAEAVDRRRLVPEHSLWELAIRWGTVHAAARLVEALNSRGNPVTAPQLDYHLWWSAVLGPEAERMGEHHRTVTLAY